MNTRTTVHMFFLIVGILLLITGLSLKINWGVLAIHAVFSTALGIAHYKKAGPIAAGVFGGIGTALMMDISLYEACYLFGGVSIAYALAEFSKTRIQGCTE